MLLNSARQLLMSANTFCTATEITPCCYIVTLLPVACAYNLPVCSRQKRGEKSPLGFNTVTFSIFRKDSVAFHDAVSWTLWHLASSPEVTELSVKRTDVGTSTACMSQTSRHSATVGESITPAFSSRHTLRLKERLGSSQQTGRRMETQTHWQTRCQLQCLPWLDLWLGHNYWTWIQNVIWAEQSHPPSSLWIWCIVFGSIADQYCAGCQCLALNLNWF